MKTGARVAAAIAVLAEVEARHRPLAEALKEWGRDHRFAGSGDRAQIASLAYDALRRRASSAWRFGADTPRAWVLGALAFVRGQDAEAIAALFAESPHAPEALDEAERSALAAASLDGAPPWVLGDYPEWLDEAFARSFGEGRSEEGAALAMRAPLDLRVNTLKATREDARAALAAEGWKAEPTPFSPWGLRIQGRRPVTAGPAFQSGLVEIQDEGSQLVAVLADVRPGMRVADWCAGAGGKTLALAGAMQNRGQLLACDVSAARLDGAVRRLRRAGVHNVERHLVVAGDKWAKRRAGSFDRVLVDAPCTGTGTWRRNPDARLRLRESDLLELLPKQASILDAAQGLVRKAGRLVYATCSLLPEENEAQVTAFLARHPGFSLVPAERAAALAPGLRGDDGFLSLTPAQHGTDGFFAAVMERVA